MSTNIITVSELPDPNCTYIVTCNGVEYKCAPVVISDGGPSDPICTLGNIKLLDSSCADTREPFVIAFFYNEGQIELEFVFENDSIDNVISIDKVTTPVKQLEPILSRRVINFMSNPYTLSYYRTLYASIEPNLSVVDLIGSIAVTYNTWSEELVGAGVCPNGAIYLIGSDDNYLYNPYSGYFSLDVSWNPESFDISSTILESPNFESAFLKYKNGDPVICNFVAEDINDNSKILLSAAEPVLKDSEGNIIHDFRIGPIIYDTNTGKFNYGDTSWEVE